MSGKLKIALIGTGGWGRQHARILSSRADVDFCAVVGRNPDKTTAYAAEYGTRAYTDIQQMLDQQKPDLVSLCLPNQGHYDATMQVIQAGFPLLVEKPIVFELDEADRLIAEAARRNLFFALNFNHRYAKPVQMARQAIGQDELGQLNFVSWRFGGDGSSDHPHANLIETQCHGFDTLEYLCGPIHSIMAEMANPTGNGFTTLVLSLKFVNGAVGSMIGTYDSSYAYTDTQRVELNGSKARILIQDTVKSYSFQRSHSETAEVWQAGYFNDYDREFLRTFDRHMDELLIAFRKGEQPPVHAEAGRRALLLANAAIESYKTGCRVVL